MTASCKTCPFRPQTRCRRFPPTAAPGAAALWPVTRDDDWCGEHPDRHTHKPESAMAGGRANRPAPAKPRARS